MSRSNNVDFNEFPQRLKIFFWVIISVILGGTFGFMLLAKQNFSDALVRVMHTLAFMFYDNPTIYERTLEVMLAVVGVFLIWWVLWSSADMILEGKLKKYLKKQYYGIKIMQMRNHYIIVGGGRLGEELATILKTQKKSLIIIDNNPSVIAHLKKKKFVLLEHDAHDEQALIQAGIKVAKKLVVALPRTEDNVMIPLSAKELNPNIEVHARCDNSLLINKLKKAGASFVTIPEHVAAEKIASQLLVQVEKV